MAERASAEWVEDDVDEDVDEPETTSPWPSRFIVGGTILAAGAVGAVIRGFFPEYWLPAAGHGEFWHAFMTGPPIAGLFALAGAGLAWAAATRSARVAKQAAERSEWWARAEWALDLARSDKKSDRLIGFRTLQALIPSGTRAEQRIIAATTKAITGDRPTRTGGSVESHDDSRENGSRRRWWTWLFPRRRG